MPRGGHRENAGRKSGWNYSDTQVIRVPKAFASQLLEIAKKLDSGSDAVYESVSNSNDRILQQVEQIGMSLLNDETVTRHGKDRASVRRAILALINRLSDTSSPQGNQTDSVAELESSQIGLDI